MKSIMRHWCSTEPIFEAPYRYTVRAPTPDYRPLSTPVIIRTLIMIITIEGALNERLNQ